jgi:hypothetical protein
MLKTTRSIFLTDSLRCFSFVSRCRGRSRVDQELVELWTPAGRMWTELSFTTLEDFTSLFFIHESQVTKSCHTIVHMSVQRYRTLLFDQTTTTVLRCRARQWLAFTSCHDYLNHDRTPVIPCALRSRKTSASDSQVGLSHATATAHPAGIVASPQLGCSSQAPLTFTLRDMRLLIVLDSVHMAHWFAREPFDLDPF